MKEFQKMNLFFCVVTILIIGSGCMKKKPEGSTGPLSSLYSVLSNVVMLERQYKNGKINRQDYEIKKDKLEQIITDEFSTHKTDVWKYSINILSNTPISKTTSSLIYRMKPVKRLTAIDEWSGNLKPLPAMFSMLPLQMTMTVIKPAFSQEEYSDLKYAYRPVELIYLDNRNCTTAFLFGYKIITVDFTLQEYRWKPEEIRVYIQNEKPGQNSKSKTKTVISQP